MSGGHQGVRAETGKMRVGMSEYQHTLKRFRRILCEKNKKANVSFS